MTEVTPRKYPDHFSPFESLTVCGNRFENGKCIIEVDNTPILLIGRNGLPNVWLAMPEYVAGTSKIVWVYAVNRNRALHTEIEVQTDNTSTSLRYKDEQIIHAIKQTEDSAEIDLLDLRPVGFQIFGNSEGLTVAKNKLTGNTFRGIDTMLDITRHAVIGYNVYMSTDRNKPLKEWTRMNDRPVPTTRFIAEELTPNTTYYSYVTAINAAGIESGPSEIAVARTEEPSGADTRQTNRL